ncbi:hypothetical protein SEA_SPEEDDEMON_910 [Gordonia phage SpeedDemon]|uniref:Uncharacterized protein n=1 Tax=Gordonia phage Bantam TaxID=1887641 RepID=A0A1B3AYE2_9CAUD|nr:hypothetical protein BIZ77_gp089 [Gordonia phage Bantam]AOE43779.1 hypothetical protein SEA_BANTAM_90 [Gordonia phage Bantam]QNL30541.1 hypothetical protein SEA_SPEEDDEMON_910 [Gordonia phage SpeedDemon]
MPDPNPVCEFRDLFSECGEQASELVRHEKRWGGEQWLCADHRDELARHIAKERAA